MGNNKEGNSSRRPALRESEERDVVHDRSLNEGQVGLQVFSDILFLENLNV